LNVFHAVCVDIDKLWNSEGWLLLEIRMEVMGRMKKMATIAQITRVFHIITSRGKDWYWPDSSVGNDGDLLPAAFDPYRYPREVYYELLDLSLPLWKKEHVSLEVCWYETFKIILDSLFEMWYLCYSFLPSCQCLYCVNY
jgi:hypothetical protein